MEHLANLQTITLFIYCNSMLDIVLRVLLKQFHSYPVEVRLAFLILSNLL